MDWREALEIVVARTKHEPYRRLCGEDNPDAFGREGCRRLMVATAMNLPAEALSPPAAAETARLLKLAKECPWRSVDPPCGCSGARCALRFTRGAAGSIVSPQECIACVRTYGLA